MIDKGYMKEISKENGFLLDEAQLDQLDIYAQKLVEWNEKVNLTAITSAEGIAVKHFLDSFLLLKSIDIKENTSLIDVGTGAGFPALPCHILRKDLKVTLMDGLNKRITFLNDVAVALKMKVNCVHGRAEECGNKKEYREQFDIATARAVANLRELCEYCLPFVKVGGYFVALKGYEIEAELEEAKEAIKTLGGQIEGVKKFVLPDESKRGIVLIKKISQTPTKYPRNQGKINKQPL